MRFALILLLASASANGARNCLIEFAAGTAGEVTSVKFDPLIRPENRD